MAKGHYIWVQKERNRPVKWGRVQKIQVSREEGFHANYMKDDKDTKPFTILRAGIA